MRQHLVLEFGYPNIMIPQNCCLFLVLKAALHKCSHFLNLPHCSSCSVTCLYLICHYIQITDDYLSKLSYFANILWKHHYSSMPYCCRNSRNSVKSIVIHDFIYIAQPQNFKSEHSSDLTFIVLDLYTEVETKCCRKWISSMFHHFL